MFIMKHETISGTGDVPAVRAERLATILRFGPIKCDLGIDKTQELIGMTRVA
jgi:hypothetical protein